MNDKLIIKGARTHNLKNINLEIPKNKLVVITGLSGSGKSSLAFDTIYAEGQRRYVESLSAYARQFLEMMEKPDLDLIENLSPSISIQQHSPTRNPRSTVGTTTEIYDYLRLLFARIGKPHCYICKRPLKAWTVEQIINDIKQKFYNKEITVLAVLVRGRIGTYEELFSRLKSKGFTNIRVDGKNYSLNSPPKLERYKKHDISIIIDRYLVSESENERIVESIELAFGESDIIEIIFNKNSILYSKKNSCPYCGITIGEIEPRLFSFNSPYGACENCQGIGFVVEVDIDSVINREKTIDEGAVIAWEDPITNRTNRWKNSWKNYYRSILDSLCYKYHIPKNVVFKELSEEHKNIILYGDEEFEGVITNIKKRYSQTESDYVKSEIYNRYLKEMTCKICLGKRLKKEALSVLINGKNIAHVCDMTINELKSFISSLNLSSTEMEISKIILKEINSRIDFLLNVGLSYLTLSRYSQTLSGGEAQRINLATQIGSRLSGVIYVLDEPTIGLHPSDNEKLIRTLKSLRDLGNTLIVVEHDEKTIRNADWIIELGPGAGVNGGKVVFEGGIKDIINSNVSLTGKYLSGKLIATPPKPPKSSKEYIKVIGASQFNLKNIDVRIPIGLITVICGVSGSGKSTLLYEVLYKGIMKKLNPNFKEEPGKFRDIKGIESIKRVVLVDQSPIGRSSRSNPGTYIGFFDEIRKLFSMTPSARRKGYKPKRFSFNVSGGRCENCKGEGYITIQMQFLPDVHILCEECQGKRFNKETLEIKYKDKNIYDILEMDIENAGRFFEDIPPIHSKLKLLEEVGLGYLKIGQSSTTLSGGEAQRIKLAYELSKKNTGSNLYIFDEPTTGLHFADVEKLLKVLLKLRSSGNTIVIIEHNPDVIKFADWIIELGPEGGPDGGYLIYEGTLDNLKNSKLSKTKDYIFK